MEGVKLSPKKSNLESRGREHKSHASKTDKGEDMKKERRVGTDYLDGGVLGPGNGEENLQYYT